MVDKIILGMVEAEEKALEALSGYKFWMFGYHCARWVNYNRLLSKENRQPNPFRDFVKLARQKIDDGVSTSEVQIQTEMFTD